MKQALLIVGSAIGNPTEFDGKYVKSYDPHEGEHGKITVTTNLAEAKHYESAGAALAAWQEINKSHPRRPDGKPNRPLTAFTVEMVKLP